MIWVEFEHEHGCKFIVCHTLDWYVKHKGIFDAFSVTDYWCENPEMEHYVKEYKKFGTLFKEYL